MRHYRTILSAFNHIKQVDPDSDLTIYYLRELVRNGHVPSRRAGKKYLISLEDIEKYMAGGFDGAENDGLRGDGRA